MTLTFTSPSAAVAGGREMTGGPSAFCDRAVVGGGVTFDMSVPGNLIDWPGSTGEACLGFPRNRPQPAQSGAISNRARRIERMANSAKPRAAELVARLIPIRSANARDVAGAGRATGRR